MFVIELEVHGKRRFVFKGDGINVFVRDPIDATVFDTREAAHNARPGHHRDMGGSGFKGRVVERDRAVRNYLSRWD